MHAAIFILYWQTAAIKSKMIRARLRCYMSRQQQDCRDVANEVESDLCIAGNEKHRVLAVTQPTHRIGQIVSSFGISPQKCADDTQLYISISVNYTIIGVTKLERCLLELHSWFCSTGLCRNPSKYDAILFGTHQRLHHSPALDHVNIAGSSVSLSDKVTTLGVTLDCCLTFNNTFHLYVEHHSFILGLYGTSDQYSLRIWQPP